MYGSRKRAINFRNWRHPLNSLAILRKMGASLVLGGMLAGRVAGSAWAQTTGPVRITLDEAVQMALQHNHNLLAARTTIQQNQAEEITANLRPNPTLLGDAEYLSPSHPTSDYLSNA